MLIEVASEYNHLRDERRWVEAAVYDLITDIRPGITSFYLVMMNPILFIKRFTQL